VKEQYLCLHRTSASVSALCNVLHYFAPSDSRRQDNGFQTEAYNNNNIIIIIIIIIEPDFLKKKKKGIKVVGLERGPLSLVSATEELLDRKVAAPV
jgi:hypothetical protein